MDGPIDYVLTLFSLTEGQPVIIVIGDSLMKTKRDPGIVFNLSNHANIHNCLMLLSVATVAGTHHIAQLYKRIAYDHRLYRLHTWDSVLRIFQRAFVSHQRYTI